MGERFKFYTSIRNGCVTDMFLNALYNLGVTSVMQPQISTDTLYMAYGMVQNTLLALCEQPQANTMLFEVKHLLQFPVMLFHQIQVNISRYIYNTVYFFSKYLGCACRGYKSVNSSGPSDVYMPKTSYVQIAFCHLLGVNYYLNGCWLITKLDHRKILIKSQAFTLK